MKEIDTARMHTVQTFVLRAGRMTKSQQRSYAEFMHCYGLVYQIFPLNMKDVFNNDNPVIVEIGFGNGDAIVQMAQKTPHLNYLGIEVFKAGIGKILGSIQKAALKNIRIIEHDALDVFENMIKDESIAGIHTFFPDPWHKKRHAKRRLIHRPRTDVLTSKLQKNGYIYFVTDIEDYACDAKYHLEQTPHIHVCTDTDVQQKPWRPKTKFEQKAAKQGRGSFEIFCKKL